MFSIFLESSQMSRVFYHSVIQGLGFFTCFMMQTGAKQKNMLFLSTYFIFFKTPSIVMLFLGVYLLKIED